MDNQRENEVFQIPARRCKRCGGDGGMNAQDAPLWRSKPKCEGCRYRGTDIPCEYILITGRSPQSQGAHIDPEGEGGCELYERGEQNDRRESAHMRWNAWKRQHHKRINDRKAMALYSDGASDGEIAAALGVSKGGVAHWRRARGLVPTHAQGFTVQIDYAAMRRLYETGRSDAELAAALGAAVTTVRAWRKKNGLKQNKKEERT